MALQIEKTSFGDAEVTQIVELSISHLMGGLLPDAVRAIGWMKPPYRNADYALNAISQCFIIKKGDRLFVVDTCIGNEKNVSAIPDLANLQLDFLEVAYPFNSAGSTFGRMRDRA